MYRKHHLFGFILCLSFTVNASDFNMINLSAPTGLYQGQKNFSIRHRFYGDLSDKPFDTFLGMDEGANVQIGFRYQLFRNLEAKIFYTRRLKEKLLGLSYKIAPEAWPIQSQIELMYFRFVKPELIDENRGNLLGLLAVQHDPLFERMITTLNVGYDNYYKRTLFGLGMTVLLFRDVGISEQISLVGEYVPVLDKSNQSWDLEDSSGITLGIKVDTYGHRFLFILTNTDDLHLHRISFGVPDNAYWRLGFNIERIF